MRSQVAFQWPKEAERRARVAISPLPPLPLSSHGIAYRTGGAEPVALWNLKETGFEAEHVKAAIALIAEQHRLLVT